MKKRLAIEVNFKRRANRGRVSADLFQKNISKIYFEGEPGNKVYEQDISDIAIRRQSLVTAFITYFRKTFGKNTTSSKIAEVRYFRYFNHYLDAYEAAFGVSVSQLSDLTTLITLGYADWLDGNRHVDSELRLATNTKNVRYNATKRFIKYCQRSNHYRDQVSQTLGFRPAWDAQHKPSARPNALVATDIASLRKACKDAISGIRRKFDWATEVVSDATISVPDLYLTTSLLPFRDAKVRLKAAAKAFGINRLSGDFRSSMRGIARSLRAPYGEVGDVISQLYFTPETLLPFILMIGLPTCFNEIGLLTLRQSNIKRGVGILGDQRLFLIGLKARAGRHQRRSFPIASSDPFSMDALISTVTSFTTSLREHVEGRYSDTLFIAARTTGDRPAGFFDEKNKVNGTIDRALKKFLKLHNIKEFNLNDLRLMGADIAAMMSEGDTKVQQILLQHSSIKTTETHYQTAQAAAARQEQLAHLMNERERFISSGARIDPRNAGASTGLYRASTPGFDCLDAMNSPIHGQRPGKLCSAYGKCFGCPRAVLFTSTVNAARLLQMSAQLEQARATINRARWIVEWEKEYRMLRDFWLLIIPAQVIENALTLELPPVPSIE